MGYWHFIQSEGGTNYALNPSAETTGNFAADGGATVTRSTTYSKFGAYSYRVQTVANADGVNLTTGTLSNAVHHLTFWVAGTIPANGITTYCSTWAAATLVKTQGDWSLYERAITAADASAETSIVIAQSGAGSGDFYVDGILLEQKSGYYTTYIDGDQSGCEWNGAAHGSTSIRHGLTRAGGRVIDIEETYGLGVVAMTGWGTPPVSHNITDYALLPGAELQSVKTKIRPFTLVFESSGSLDTIHTARDYLIEAFKPERWPDDPFVRLRYTGATDEVEIAAVYEGGLEGSLVGDDGVTERMAARFLAYDPYWYGIGEDAYNMTTRTVVASVGYIARRYQGSWQGLDAGTGGTVYAIDVGPDGRVYVGGNFTNLGGDANQDYIAVFDPQAGTWAALGTGCNDIVRAVKVASDGTVYAGGDFLLAGGVADTVRVAHWTGSAWEPLSTGLNAPVYAIDIGQDGSVYIGGNFDNAGDANGDYIVIWTGSAWSSLGTGMNSGVDTIKVASDGTVYVGGDFTTAGGTAVDRIAKWNGSAWSALGTPGFDSSVLGLAISPGGILYAGGAFTASGGAFTDYIAQWNGSAWATLGTGVAGGQVIALHIDSQGLLWAGGGFTSAGGLTLADRMAIWNGTSWVHVNADLPGSPSVWAIASHSYKGIGGDTIYLGYTTTGDLARAALQVVTNNGTAPAYPRFIIKRSGGTAARLEWLANETTKKRLWLNYSLIDGETLTIDFAAKTITSDFFGNVIGRALLPGSAFAAFSLRPGTNSVGLYVYETGTPTLTCNLVWREAYLSPDGAN